MSDRPPGRQSRRPAVREQGPAPRLPGFGPGFIGGLVAILRLGLLAITFAGALSVLLNVFRGAAVARTVGAAPGSTYLALTLAAAAAVLMVALTVNAAFSSIACSRVVSRATCSRRSSFPAPAASPSGSSAAQSWPRSPRVPRSPASKAPQRPGQAQQRRRRRGRKR